MLQEKGRLALIELRGCDGRRVKFVSFKWYPFLGSAKHYLIADKRPSDKIRDSVASHDRAEGRI